MTTDPALELVIQPAGEAWRQWLKLTLPVWIWVVVAVLVLFRPLVQAMLEQTPPLSEGKPAWAARWWPELLAFAEAHGRDSSRR